MTDPSKEQQPAAQPLPTPYRYGPLASGLNLEAEYGNTKSSTTLKTTRPMKFQ